MDSQLVNNGRPRQPDEGQVDTTARKRLIRPWKLMRPRICPYCNRIIFYAQDYCVHVLVQCPRLRHLSRNTFLNPDQRMPEPVPHPLPAPPQTQAMPHPLPIPPSPPTHDYPIAGNRRIVDPSAMFMPEVGSHHGQQPLWVHDQVNGSVRNNMTRAFNGLLFGYGRNGAVGGHVVNQPPAGIRRDNMVLLEARAPEPGIQRDHNPEKQIDLELRLGLPTGE